MHKNMTVNRTYGTHLIKEFLVIFRDCISGFAAIILD